MILVHTKGTPDPYGAQAEIMRYVAGYRQAVSQHAIEAHILGKCQCLAISGLEYLINSGALEQPEGSPTMFMLSAKGIEWCRANGIKVAGLPRYVEQEDDQDGQDEPEPVAAEPAAPKKRGRARRETPAPE